MASGSANLNSFSCLQTSHYELLSIYLSAERNNTTPTYVTLLLFSTSIPRVHDYNARSLVRRLCKCRRTLPVNL